ncbi:MAG: universal stress protein, partial [Candidatus Sumerlaeota bacterium]
RRIRETEPASPLRFLLEATARVCILTCEYKPGRSLKEMIMKRILVAVDFSEVTDQLIAKALEIGRAFDSKILLIHTEPDEPEFVGYGVGPQYIRDSVAKDMREDMRRLEDYRRRIEAEGLQADCRQIQGPTVEKVLQEAKDFKADLLIIGSHEHGAWHELLVGTMRNLIHHSPCPVLVIPQHDEKK